MSSLASVLMDLGLDVTGCDIYGSPIIDNLRRNGMGFWLGHSTEHIDEETDVVVYSSAIHPDNPELVFAKSKNINVIPRFEMLSELVRLRRVIAVIGSHGKTTTASLLGHILKKRFDPLTIIGGKVRGRGGNRTFLGSGEFAVVEIDESDRNFLMMSPTIVILTNLDFEHIEKWGNFAELKKSVLKFLNSVPFWGFSVICKDDSVAFSLTQEMNRKFYTYSIKDDSADVFAYDINTEKSEFRVSAFGRECGKFNLQILGMHNIQNFLSTFCTAKILGLKNEEIKKASESFKGVQRRLEIKTKNGLIIVDDYAHHPTEIAASLSSIRDRFKEKKLFLVFQPHRYSRTSLLFDKFVEVLSTVDYLGLLEIYGASEKNIWDVSSEKLIEKIKERKTNDQNIFYFKTKEDCRQILKEMINDGRINKDFVLVLMGAGDIKDVNL